jgi:STE24 endopeptidase
MRRGGLRGATAMLLAALFLGAPAVAGAGAGDVEARRPAAWDRVEVDLSAFFTAEEIAEWKGRANRRRAVSFGMLLASLGLYAAFVFTGLGRATFRLAERLAGGLRRRAPSGGGRFSAALGRVFGERWAAGLLFTWIFLAAVALCLLPFQIAGEIQDRQAGLSVYTPGAWLWDWAKAQLLNTASFTCIALGLFGLIRRLPRWWWLVLGLPAAGLLVAWGVASPYQARVFYAFSPLEDPALEARLESLAGHGGITLTEVKVIDASRHTTGLNAYVTGLGPSRELVLFDTLLEALTPDEIEAVVAHELGHVARERPVLRYLLGAVALLGLLALLAAVIRAAVPRLRLAGPGDVRSLPLLLLVVSLLFFVLSPLNRAWTRHEERLADRSGLVLTGDPDAFVRLQVALARHNRADVDPAWWVRLWFATHPSVAERIGTAKWYGDWLAGRADEGPRPGDTGLAPERN